MSTRRVERINDLLRSELSELIGRELKDPRLAGLISITEVETTSDLRHAKVFVSVFGSDEERQSSLAALRSAAGFLRHEVAQRIVIRHMPELEFRLDSSIERGDRILRLLRQVAEEDAAKAPAPTKPRARARRAGPSTRRGAGG
jgi:ribosome-binding factor A